MDPWIRIWIPNFTDPDPDPDPLIVDFNLFLAKFNSYFFENLSTGSKAMNVSVMEYKNCDFWPKW